MGAKGGLADRERLTRGEVASRWNWDAMKFGGATDAIAEYGKKAF